MLAKVEKINHKLFMPYMCETEGKERINEVQSGRLHSFRFSSIKSNCYTLVLFYTSFNPTTLV